MRKKTNLLVLLTFLIALYSSYTVFSYDSRLASNLSAYCNIDFRGITDPQTNKITGATLSLVDFRYDSKPLEPSFLLTIDGKAYTINSLAVSAQSPTYSPKDFLTGKGFQHTNTLLVTFPAQLLPEIAKATTVAVSFKYTGSNSAIVLPLSTPDLQYWKNQLPSL